MLVSNVALLKEEPRAKRLISRLLKGFASRGGCGDLGEEREMFCIG